VARLADRLVAVHEAMDVAGIPHAFGGAIALAYCTEEPRGTRDLDVNVFVPPADAERVLGALPVGVAFGDDDVTAIRRDGQARVWWDETPVDLFFDVHAFHRRAAETARSVPFEGTRIPVIDCVSLVVFKAFFNRTRDWADIEAMFEAGALEGDEALAWVSDLLGEDAPATQRLRSLVG
jgi:hypothetical protein